MKWRPWNPESYGIVRCTMSSCQVQLTDSITLSLPGLQLFQANQQPVQPSTAAPAPADTEGTTAMDADATGTTEGDTQNVTM